MPIEKSEPLSRGVLEHAASRLEAIAAKLRAVAGLMEESQAKELWTFRAPSLARGLERLESFGTELDRSTAAMLSGNPFGPETTKGQSSAGKSKRAGKPSAAAPKKAPAKKRSGPKKKGG